MNDQSPFQKLLRTPVPLAYHLPQDGSRFPTQRYPFLLFCLMRIYEDLERSNESDVSKGKFLTTCQNWIKGLEFEEGDNDY